MARLGFAVRGCALAVGLGALACGSGGGGEDAADSSESGSSSDDGASSDESGEACVADCQPGGTVLFEQTFGAGPGDDGTTAVASDAEGRMVIVGYSVIDDFEGSTTNSFVVLYGADGMPLFQQTFPEHARGVAFAADGSVVVGGDTVGGSPWLRAYDATGAMVWETIDTAHGPMNGGRIARLDSGELVMGGGGETSGLLMRFSATGELLAYNETDVNIYVTGVVSTGDGVVAVGVDNMNLGWVGRMEANDTIAWSMSTGGGSWSAVALADDGSIAVAATSPANTTQIQIYDADGKLVISGATPRVDAVINDLAVLPNGDIIVVGAAGDFQDRAYIARLDGIDSFAWEHDLAVEPGTSTYHNIVRAADGTLVASGAKQAGMFGTDAWIQRLAPG
jgi:hypothetical protein